MSSASGKKISSNMMWRLLERIGAQGVSFIVSIIIARLLDPSVYGSIALVMVFITILQVFVDSGLGNALIQKKDADDLDFSSVFYFNIFFCIVFYLGIFLCAPFIATFYSNNELIPVIRVLGFTVVISGVKNIIQAYISKTLQFKKFFWATISGTIGAAFIGVFLAAKGFGVWALVIQNLFNQTVDTIILWITVKWRPKRCFSFIRLKKLLSFGWKLLVAKLIDTFYNELRTLIIGKKYSTSDLAYYNKGQQFPRLVITNIDIAVESVLFPVMSAEQDNRTKVKTILQRVVQINSYILCPMMMGLAVCCEPLIRLLLTDKWIFCVPYMRLFCFVYAFSVLNTANMNTYRSLGRSDIYLIIEFIRKSVGIVIILISMRFGVFAIALGEVITTIISIFINTAPNKKLLNYGIVEQLKDMFSTLVLTCIMGLFAYLPTFLGLTDLLLLLIQIFVGVISYLVFSIIFKPKAYVFLVDTIKKRRN